MKRTYSLFYPIGLMNLLDRFAFYGTRAMLVLFFTSEIGFSSEYAYEFYGAIFALIYALPILGGWLVDRGFDRTLAIFFGIFFKMVGHFALVFAYDMPALVTAFIFIILGHMFYKPSTLTLFSDFSKYLKVERKRSFTVLFICFQIGAVLGILICGFVAEKYSWRYGMSLAAMMLLMQFLLFLSQYRMINQMIDQQAYLKIKSYDLLLIAGVVIGSVGILFRPIVLDIVFPILCLGLFIYISKIAKRVAEIERRNIFRLCFLLIVTIVYLAFYEQKAVSFNMYVKYFLDRDFFGFVIPATWFQIFPSLSMIIFAFGGVWVWMMLSKRGKAVTNYDQYLLGLICMVFAHMSLYLGLLYQTEYMLWVFLLSYVFIGISESIIYPNVMAATSIYAPGKYRNFFMGLMTFSGSISHYLASELSKFSAPKSTDDGLLNVVGFTHLLLVMTIGFVMLVMLMLLVRKKFKAPQ